MANFIGGSLDPEFPQLPESEFRQIIPGKDDTVENLQNLPYYYPDMNEDTTDRMFKEDGKYIIRDGKFAVPMDSKAYVISYYTTQLVPGIQHINLYRYGDRLRLYNSNSVYKTFHDVVQHLAGPNFMPFVDPTRPLPNSAVNQPSHAQQMGHVLTSINAASAAAAPAAATPAAATSLRWNNEHIRRNQARAAAAPPAVAAPAAAAAAVPAEAALSINESPFYSDTTEPLDYFIQKPGDYIFRNSKLTLPNVKIYTLEYVHKSNTHRKIAIILDTDNYYKMVKAPTNKDPTTTISEHGKEKQLNTLVNKLITSNRNNSNNIRISNSNINGIIPIEKATNSNLLHMYHGIFIRGFGHNNMNDLFTTTNIPFIVIQPYVNGDYVVYFRTQINTVNRFGFPINDKANFTEENIFRLISEQNQRFYNTNASSSIKEWTKHLGNFGSMTNDRHYLSILGNPDDISSCSAENTLASPSNHAIIQALLNIPENASIDQINTYFQSTKYPKLLRTISTRFLHGHARATTHMMCLDSTYGGNGGKWKLLLSDKIYSKLRRDPSAATTDLIPIRFSSELQSEIAKEVYPDQSAITRVSNKQAYSRTNLIPRVAGPRVAGPGVAGPRDAILAASGPATPGPATPGHMRRAFNSMPPPPSTYNPSRFEPSTAAIPGGRRVKRHTRAHKKSRHIQRSKKSRRTHHKTKRHRK